MTTYWKTLCAEILKTLDDYEDGLRVDWDDWRTRARTALSQPEPEEPTDEELLATAAASIDGYQDSGITVGEYEAEAWGPICSYGSDLIAFARTILATDRARWPRAAIKPVPVSERLPGERDCDPSFQCWWFTPSEEKWILWPIKWAGPECSHWLPYYALPIPTTTTETP